MPLPNLLHKTNIVIQQIDKGDTIYDEDTREPVQQAHRTVNKDLKGQVHWGQADDLEPGAGGVQEESDGYVLFRYLDLDKKGIALSPGDRIIKMGRLNTDVYLIKLQPMAHYEDQNGPSTVRAYFKDRQPSKQGLGLGTP